MPPPERALLTSDGREVSISNPSKVLFPDAAQLAVYGAANSWQQRRKASGATPASHSTLAPYGEIIIRFAPMLKLFTKRSRQLSDIAASSRLGARHLRPPAEKGHCLTVSRDAVSSLQPCAGALTASVDPSGTCCSPSINAVAMVCRFIPSTRASTPTA